MKRLTITYDGRELYDGDIAEFSWTESDTEITVRGRTVAKQHPIADALRNAAAQAVRNNDGNSAKSSLPSSVNEGPAMVPTHPTAAQRETL